ncbi:MAG: ABC transporter ATP-binding protein, partial [Spirochaetales bacterium]|nr:ABC transporter ATP-binding protein [Spirochaetales bacterium]
MSISALQGDALSIGYHHGSRGKTVVAEQLGLRLDHGEIVCLVGPNGVGKSTLLRTLTGLQPLLSGTVRIEGTDIRKLDIRARARKIGVVLTERTNVGILPAFDLVALGRHPHTGWSGRLSAHDISVIEWAIASVGALELSARDVNELSDGERQKIMIARALAQEPAIVVLDEPTAFLDLPRRVEILGLLKQLTRSTNRAILLSTHDLDLAIRAADRLWLMTGDGKIVSGAPEDLVLNGELESAFSGRGISFDRDHGSFHLTEKIEHYISFAGEGAAAAWTLRALRREGIGISKNANLRVEVGKNRSWTFENGDHKIVCNSIYDTIRTVRNHVSGHDA